jgi:aminopeptidase N
MPGARDSWYPGGEGGMGDFVNYHMTFHIPKNLQVVATGNLVTQTPDTPGFTKVLWETSAPIPVAGFNVGDFKARDEKTPNGFGVSAYANVGNATSMETGVQALPNEVSQGLAAIQIYSDYFGKLPYDHVALTPQPVCDYGQSWPMLVYLPACAFWDSTALNAYGLLDFDASYWKEVTPHEVSHQWWGNLVGFNSYRDQWMSEGFANFSVSLFLMKTSPKMDDYRAFWKEQQTNLIEKNPQGKRPIDVGALTMGGRISNDKNGNVYQMLIYSKGAYVLHMMEMQFWDPREQDEPFKRAMQQFVKDYSGKAATTEDWKASMEKSMPKTMDLRGDGKLDWFFDEFINGTELPHYTTSSEFTVGADGVTSAHMKITQSNVSNTFVMRVPVYLQLQNGITKRIFNAVMHGNATIDQTVKLPGKFPSLPKAILVNYNADILTDN